MKRKIGLISEHASPLATLGGVDSGGQNVYVGELAKYLGTLGYEIDVFTRRDDERLPQVVTWAPNVRVIHVKAGPTTYVRKEDLLQYMDEFTDNVLAFSRENDNPCQLFHANFWMSGLVAAEIKKRTGIPFVVTFHALGKVRIIHQGKADQFPATRLDIEARIIREADQIIAECPQEKDELIQYYDADPQSITVIPCGVNLQQFHPIDQKLARMLLGFDPDEQIILQLGRMVPRKGVETVIEALAKMTKPARLVIVGGESDEPDPEKTPEIGRLMRVAESLGIPDRITFTGRRGRDMLRYYYSAADVFVTVPWYEPFGMTPLEAMACGTPVIGAKVGGIQYSVADGETGYLIPPKNPMALAKKLDLLLADPQTLSKLRSNAVQRVNTKFTWSQITSSISNLYERVISTYETPEEFHDNKFSIIDRSFNSAVETLNKSSQLLRLPIMQTATAMSSALTQGRKILVCGNGGSASQSQHFAAEFVGKFLDAERPGLPVISLTADSAILTAWANDFSYDQVFARQVEAYGKQGDVLLAITTSGSSPNVLQALKKAHKWGLTTVALLGKSGGDAAGLADISIIVPSYDTQRIQELHIHILHILCELVEKNLVTLKPVEFAAVLPPKKRYSGVVTDGSTALKK